MKKFARFTALVLVLVMTLATALPVMANTATTPFRDVPATHFAFNAINWVSHPDNGGIMVGDPAGNFHPNQTMTKFVAARIFAMAAGFRPATHPVPAELRAEINRAFDAWSPLLDTMAAQHSQWTRIADREIAFLLYREVLNASDLERFVGARLTRQEAVAWMVRLLGRQAHAAAIVLPFHNPFNDNAQIAPEFIRYVYYAREAGLVAGGSGNNFMPTDHFTRAQLAMILYNALGGENAVQLQPGASTPMSTVTGTVELVYRNTQIFISSPLGPQNYTIAATATIFVDNVQRTAAFIRPGMTISAVLNAQNEIISLVARTAQETPQNQQNTQQQATVPDNIRLYADEGFVVSTTVNPPAITIRTRRVRITGQIVDEERTFTLAPNATISRGDAVVPLSDAQPQDIAFFRFSGTVIHELELEDRERELEGTLIERRLVDHLGNQVVVVELAGGERFELRVLSTTEISRGNVRNLRIQDLRIGDSVVALLESGQLTRLQAVGQRTTVEARLTEIRVTQNFSEITVQREDGRVHVFTIMPGVFDVYSLRIGMEIRVFLDSWEVMDIQIVSQRGQQLTAALGYIQAIRAGQTIIVVELDSQNPRSHTIVINNDTIDTATGQRFDFNRLRVNMNVYVVMVGPHSNVARSVTILP
ncbi:MAG: S-layer homology domain-containing protein [Defluviitaleaceae bacterium]|nr:S-layer homology domain-containing protein [Defluviitaleaceae bacterium]MCL2203773.1 S-layer homology domain-containing protein [Defluviitaleaceae bacterium]MCL2239242.1 S-layer homology domain-containing protein [Defluviitaleaceae bacterium]